METFTFGSSDGMITEDIFVSVPDPEFSTSDISTAAESLTTEFSYSSYKSSSTTKSYTKQSTKSTIIYSTVSTSISSIVSRLPSSEHFSTNGYNTDDFSISAFSVEPNFSKGNTDDFSGFSTTSTSAISTFSTRFSSIFHKSSRLTTIFTTQSTLSRLTSVSTSHFYTNSYNTDDFSFSEFSMEPPTTEDYDNYDSTYKPY